jgi:MerR family transcriptional regulator/heat shock protein HspR
MAKSYALTLWRTENSLLTLEELAKAAGMTPEVVDAFIRCRLVEPSLKTTGCALFPISCVERLKRILRLRYDLGVNLAGVGVILEMTERIEDLKRELIVLRRYGSPEE